MCYHLAEPIGGLGIALPVFVPAPTTGIVALLLSRDRAAPLSVRRGGDVRAKRTVLFDTPDDVVMATVMTTVSGLNEEQT